MKRIQSKLTGAFVVLLLFAAAVTTANSQPPGKTIDLNALAARGEAIVNADPDPLVLELRNQQPEGPNQRGFYIGMAIAEGHTLPGPGKDRICASLPRGESQECSIAVSLSVDRNRNADLAARGAAIAKTDPLVARARTMVLARPRDPNNPNPDRRSPDVLYTLGFDIGMAAAEGQTAPGPGKQKIHDALSLRAQGGFATAVTFSLERNRNADFAARGAAIAEQDTTGNLAAARTAKTDVLYWLGFDIATGIFGDPALGAQGNTATGPGSLKIRDSLSAAGQMGFNASVTFHLSRKY